MTDTSAASGEANSSSANANDANNSTVSDPSTSSACASAPSKPPKIVLKRVLEINDTLKLHLYGTQLIVEAGLMLNIPQITISKAQIIYHRFYHRKNLDLVDYPPFHIAMTCTYLASKLDENTRRHRDILTVFDRLYKKRNSVTTVHLRTIDPHGKRYPIWKENLFNFEIRVLAAMGFNCSIESSHKYLLQLLVDLEANQNLAKQAWTLLNDFHRLPNILNYSSLEVACSCIFLAARRLKIKLPDDPSWCELFGVDKAKLHEIASIILELLELPQRAYKIPSNINEDDESLDYNPQTVKNQMRVIQKRNLEKQKRINAAKREIQRQHTAPMQATTAMPTKTVVLPKMVTVPKPILGHHHNANHSNNGSNMQPINGIKKINLNLKGKLTPPNATETEQSKNNVGDHAKVTVIDGQTKSIHFSSNSNQFVKLSQDSNSQSADTQPLHNNHTDTKVDDGDSEKKKEAPSDDKKEDKDNTMNDVAESKESVSKEEVNEKKEREKQRKERKMHRSRDRERERDRDKERRRDRERDRRRKYHRSSRRRHRSRRDERSSSDSDYHSSSRYRDRHSSSRRDRYKSRRDRERDRERDRRSRDRSLSYSESPLSESRSRSRSKTPRSDRSNKRSRSRSKQKDSKMKDEVTVAEKEDVPNV
mmetsp:Transcript_70110/g.111514  ORF Transcript_70110/g.111514 Transcript_70110/m.111514 type:complete len:650 (-) Transcript_70110:142-2091(-)